MVCFGIMDQMICEASSDALGVCVWEGSRASGRCSGGQVAEVVAPPTTPPPPVDVDEDPYNLALVWPMYLWSALTLIVLAVLLVLLLRAERRWRRVEGGDAT